jgi:curved DNA-binding protein CbpA
MPQSEMPDYYASLGLPHNATAEQIRKRFRELARKCHPDIARTKDAEERFKMINLAHQVLSDPVKRASYDLEIRRRQQRSDPPSRSPSPHRDSSGVRQNSQSMRPQPNRENPEVVLKRAQNAFRRMSFREAETFCRQCLRMDRRCADAYELLGDIRKATGRLDDAITMYSYGLQFNPNKESLRYKFDKLTRIPMQSSGASGDRGVSRNNASAKVFRWLDGSNYLSWLFIGLGALVMLVLLVVVSQAPATMSDGIFLFNWNPLLCFSLGVGGFTVGMMAETLGVLRGGGKPRRLIEPPLSWLLSFGVIAVISSPALLVLMMGLWFISRREANWVLRGIFLCIIPCLLLACVAKGGIPWVIVSGENLAFPIYLAGVIVSRKITKA